MFTTKGEHPRKTEDKKMSDMMKKAYTYRLPTPSTREDLESRWSTVLTFGDKVLLAGYYCSGRNEPCYFGAVYEFLDDDDHCCDAPIGLRAVSEVEFEDDGHAIAWAMRQ